MLYQVLLFEHNRVADELLSLNSKLNDEELFYESRKIVLSEIQQITSNEFVPALLGQEITNRLNLTSQKGKYFKKYSRKNRPGTFNEAAVSGFSLFEIMIPEKSDTKHIHDESIYFTADIIENDWNVLELLVHRSRDHGFAPYHEYQKVCRKYLQLNEETIALSNYEPFSNLYRYVMIC